MKFNTNQHRRRLAQLGFLVFALLGLAQVANAATLAADHVIRNEVTVNYDDAGGTAQTAVTDTVDIIVNLVAAAPLVADQTVDTLDPVSTNDTVTIIIDVTSRANGLDGYYIDDVGDTNNGGSIEGTTTVTPSALVGSQLLLGGTSFAGTTITTFVTTDETNDTAAGTELLVPADSDGSDSILSGFELGERIVLDPDGSNLECEVNHIVQPTAGTEFNKTASIWVDKCTTASSSISPGDQIGERDTMSLAISGTAADLIDLTFNVVDSNDTVATAQAFTVNIVAADLQVYKFVRNVTTSGNNPTCSTAAFSCLTLEQGASDVTYYRGTPGSQSGVTVAPGEVIEYAILMYNNAALVTDVRVSDPIVLFTSYEDDSVVLYPRARARESGTSTCLANGGSTGVCTIDDGTGGIPASATSTGTADTTSGDDFVFFDGTTVVVSAGHDGALAAPTSETAGNGGQIDPSVTANESEASLLLFQTKVDPN